MYKYKVGQLIMKAGESPTTPVLGSIVNTSQPNGIFNDPSYVYCTE